MNNYRVIDKTFRFSLKLMDLYILLLRNEEIELAEKMLKSSLSIRETLEEALSAMSRQDYLSKLSESYNHAVQTRYWLKMIQMKHSVNNSCDDTVEAINEIINILNHLSHESNEYNLNFQYQLN